MRNIEKLDRRFGNINDSQIQISLSTCIGKINEIIIHVNEITNEISDLKDKIERKLT